ncbi:PREDICTED: uncharacterized protein LOC108370260 [Rhagoletis zephyria]|uniref:uncharacterized protein LOC108370260 n=1 Tax=Rhagoletis zephyria TaxID=28612 RepID=UPI00081121F1|nr:PREDICTED: uncharacterized protein LOC108370260 [Rhagoletis zephyria]
MTCGIENALCFLKGIVIKLTVGPISFVFFEISKFVLVLALAFWITVGIFLLWESIMPEAAYRLSQAAEAVVANTSGLTPRVESKENVNESGSYPFVIDLPKTSSSVVETQINDESVQQAAPIETSPETEEPPSAAESSNPVQQPSPDTGVEKPTADNPAEATE